MIFNKKPHSYYHIVYAFYKCYYFQKSHIRVCSHFATLKGESGVNTSVLLFLLATTRPLQGSSCLLLVKISSGQPFYSRQTFLRLVVKSNSFKHQIKLSLSFSHPFNVNGPLGNRTKSTTQFKLLIKVFRRH